jgi:hypothetical protein
MKTVLNTIGAMLLLVALVFIGHGYVVNSVGNAIGKLNFFMPNDGDDIPTIAPPQGDESFTGETGCGPDNVSPCRPKAHHPKANTVTCEGTLEHGSGGDRIGSCWFGETESIEIAVSTFCKQQEHCRVTGKPSICRKNLDPRSCAEITELYSVQR